MKFWPLSAITDSPFMPGRFVPELQQIYVIVPSRGAYHACFEVAERMEPVQAPNLTMVSNLGMRSTYLYLHYPNLDEWLRLERGVVAEVDGERCIMMDTVH